MGADEELLDCMMRDAVGTPIVISPCAGGFTVQYDLGNAEFQRALRLGDVRQTYQIRVKVKPKRRRVSLLDRYARVSWQAYRGGLGPRLRFRAAFFGGSSVSFSAVKQWDISSGAPRVPTSYTFTSSELKNWVKSRCLLLGWKVSLPWQTRVGLVSAIAAVILSLLIYPAYWGGYSLLSVLP